MSERQRVRRLIEHAGVGILMTIDDRGTHAGRPMRPLLLDNDPHIYFLTHQSSPKVIQVICRPQIALTIANAHSYLVVVGRADVLRDPEIISKLWHPTYRAWFPNGQDDSDAAVLRVDVERVDYWESPPSRLFRLTQALRAVLTRRAVEIQMKRIEGL